MENASSLQLSQLKFRELDEFLAEQRTLKDSTAASMVSFHIAPPQLTRSRQDLRCCSFLILTLCSVVTLHGAARSDRALAAHRASFLCNSTQTSPFLRPRTFESLFDKFFILIMLYLSSLY